MCVDSDRYAIVRCGRKEADGLAPVRFALRAAVEVYVVKLSCS